MREAARLAFEKSARLAGFYPGGNEDRLVMPFGPQAAPVGLAEEHDEAFAPAPAMSQRAAPQQQPLEYQLIDLLKTEGIGEPESQAIWTLVRFLSTRGKAEQ